jgi:hypothetical protein
MHNMLRLSGWRVLVLLSSALVAACSGRDEGKRVYPVRGKVLYLGKPAPGARVYLHPRDEANKSARIRPSGTVQEDGSFRLTTYQTDDGAPAGTYAVTVVWTDRGKRGDDDGKSRLPDRYASPASSNLTVEVKETDNDLDTLNLTK